MIFFSVLEVFTFVRLTVLVAIFIKGPTLIRRAMARNPRWNAQNVIVDREFPVYKYKFYRESLQPIRESVGRSQNESIRDICPICVEAFGDQSEVVVLPCNVKHIYHANCVREWLTKHRLCPLCKRDVITEEQEGSSTND